jgi:hypothetical protein
MYRICGHGLNMQTAYLLGATEQPIEMLNRVVRQSNPWQAYDLHINSCKHGKYHRLEFLF